MSPGARRGQSRDRKRATPRAKPPPRPRQVVGRTDDGCLQERAEVRAVASAASVAGDLGDDYVAAVTLFESVDDEDRGGFVISLAVGLSESQGPDCCFFPYAALTATGVEIHIAGDSEGRAFLRALKHALEDAETHFTQDP